MQASTLSFDEIFGIAEVLLVTSPLDGDPPGCVTPTSVAALLRKADIEIQEDTTESPLSQFFRHRTIRQALKQQLGLVHSDFVLEIVKKERGAVYEIPQIDYWPHLPHPPFFIDEAFSQHISSILTAATLSKEDKAPDVLSLLLGFRPKPGSTSNLYGLEPVVLTDLRRNDLPAELVDVWNLGNVIQKIGLPSDWFAKAKIGKEDEHWEGMTVVPYEDVWDWLAAEITQHKLEASPYIMARQPRYRAEVLRAQASFNPPVAAIFGLLPEPGTNKRRVEIHIPVFSDPRSSIRRGWYVATVDLDGEGNIGVQALCETNVSLLRRHKRLAHLFAEAYLRIETAGGRPRPSVPDISELGTPAQLRPKVVIFDSYNTLLIPGKAEGRQQTEWRIASDRLADPAKTRNMTESLLRERLIGYASSLKDLARRFDVELVPLHKPLDGTEEERRCALEQALKVSSIKHVREEVAACIVGIDNWPIPEKDGSNLAISLLQWLVLRYPEIPCFTMTASLSSSSLFDALAKGAAGSLLRCKFGEMKGSLLYLEDLADRLVVVSQARFGSLDFLPQLDQLRLDDSAQAIDLSHRLNLPANRESVGKLICRMFPDVARVVPTKVVGSGKSDAQATFFAHSEVKGDKRATRFIKIGPWLSILREANACEKVIKPRLGSHVATVVGPPCFSGEAGSSSWMGALQYSTVGPPEAQDRLRSLSDILEAARQGTEPRLPCTVVKQTLEHVLRPLHESGQKKSARDSIVRYLGLSLPPLVTGELTAADAGAIDIAPASSLDLKPDAAAVLDASVWQDLKSKPRPVCRVSGPLDEVVWPTPEEPGRLTILHPTLGYRIRLRAGPGPFLQDLKREWLRPGLPVKVTFTVDQKTFRKLTLLSKDLTKHAEMIMEGTPEKHRDMIADLVRVFSFSSVPLFLFEKITLGSTHGDLNLQNILVSGEKTEIGWLIDFDRARVNGMVANDCAKLEVEIWNHFLIPALIAQCSGFASAKSAMSDCVELIDCIIGVLNHNPYRPGELVGAAGSRKFLDDPSIVAPLEAIGAVRAYSRDVLKLGFEELSWAIAAYAFTSCKFLHSKQPRERSFLSAYLSAKTMQSLLPTGTSRRQSPEEFKGDSTRKRAALIRIASRRYESNTMKKIALAIRDSTEDLPPWGPEDPQRWDFASTGSVANITPIWGYLCLMAARTTGSEHLVTKISSTGSSCGTVDILESAGLRFPSGPDEIVDKARVNGGVLCKPGEWLAPLDKELMSLRKQSNLMKSPTLVLASILGKKLALGCTHAILDVKVGKDGKMTPPRPEHRLSLPARDLHSLLRGVFGNSFQHDKEGLYVRSKPDSLPPGLQELRWIATSSDVPQCRAVGRRLILIQIDKMIESELNALPEQYRNFYGCVMPSVCSPQGATVPGDFLAALRREWTTLRSTFGEWDSVRRLAKYIDGIESDGAGDTTGLPSGLGVFTFRNDRKARRVTNINAYALDKLFEELTTRGPAYDFDVGIWLHRLPGEESELDKPLFTIFYRSAKQDQRAAEELGRTLNREIEYDT